MIEGEKKDWASREWLLSHFWAKSRNSIRHVSALPIRSGDRVLDIGCGPGLYLNYIADLVGPTGRALGIDRLSDSVKVANQLLGERGCKHASARQGDFASVREEIGSHNVVMFMNSLGYFQEPLTVIRIVAEALKPGARIIVKDYDIEALFCFPIERMRFNELMDAAWRGNAHDNPLAFNNFFGRLVPFLPEAYSFSSKDSLVWTQLMTCPFSDEQRNYIAGNILSLVQQAKGHCSDETLEYFDSEFLVGEGRFFSRRNAMFVENEFVSIMTK